jgi:RNA polymerase sigma factor (TIGR02999 family)
MYVLKSPGVLHQLHIGAGSSPRLTIASPPITVSLIKVRFSFIGFPLSLASAQKPAPTAQKIFDGRPRGTLDSLPASEVTRRLQRAHGSLRYAGRSQPQAPMARSPHEITTLLVDWKHGNRAAGEQLIEIVYPELRRLAAHYLRPERPDHTLQATALVHELYVRLIAGESVHWEDRAHFFAVAAQQLRRILIDHARGLHAAKRGGGQAKVTMADVGLTPAQNIDVLALDEALTRLEQLDPRAAKIVELRYFAGLEEKEAAAALGVSLATLKRDWNFARAWLLSQLMPSGSGT